MKKIVTLILVLLSQVSFAQNLVPNPSFEIYDTCPNNYSQIYHAIPWFQPSEYFGNVINSSSSDYFNSCSTNSNIGVPVNNGGFQYARTGNAYAGIFYYAYNGTREYLEVRLNDSLTAGKIYCVEYYVSLGIPYNIATDNFHFYFSTDSLLDTTNIYLQAIPVTPSVVNLLGNFITDTLNWTKITGNYPAIGGEKFLTIGNFYDNSNTDTINSGGNGAAVYCFVDDVSVVDCGYAGVDEDDNLQSFKSYPSPSKGFLNINLPISKKYEINVFNAMGKRVISKMTQISSGVQIDLMEESSGIYYLNIKSNKINLNKKIVLIK